MKKFILSFIIVLISANIIKAQITNKNDRSYFITLNQQIDSYVVEQNISALDSLYAADFIFSHGTGLVEGKTAWLLNVRKTKYPQRKHDSVTAELHGDIAILKGKMSIQRAGNGKIATYILKYIRVYGKRNRSWQLVSHITTEEQDL